MDVKIQFSFTSPAQVLTAVKILCCEAYWSVLWRLDSTYAFSFLKTYYSCVRRIYGLPLNTFTYVLEGHLSRGRTPVRNLVLG